MITNFAQMLDKVKDLPAPKISVAAATDPATLAAVEAARKEGIISGAVLVGCAKGMAEGAEKEGVDLSNYDCIDIHNPAAAAKRAVQAIHDGDAQIFMKGYIHTSDFLRAVLTRNGGLRTGTQLSHVFVLEATHLERLLFITDGAMNITPDLETKAQIMANAVHLAQQFDIDTPKVAVLSAVAAVKPSIPSTIDAACLAKMPERRQIKHCLVEGPLALDNAINPVAAAYKKINSPVAGHADILLVPDVVTGNALSKSMPHMYGGAMAGVLLGAAAPIVLPSRADSLNDKMLGIACAVLAANAKDPIQTVHW